MESYIGLQREESLHVIINFYTRARTKSKGGGFLVTLGKGGLVFLALFTRSIVITVCGVDGRTLSVGFHPFGFGWMNLSLESEAPK